MSRLLVSALVAGALLGLGLVMSGMTDARIVLGFLDVAGAFDPTLMFVLAGAVATTALLFTPILRRGHPLFACAFQVSNLKHIDAPLLAGAALFGIGWGIAGYCPGPALAGLGAGSLESLWFVPAMLAGSLLHRLLFR